MMILPAEIRERVRVLGGIADSTLENFISDAESYVILCLNQQYLTPIEPLQFCIGQLTTTLNSTSVSGTNTLLKTDTKRDNRVYQYNHIKLLANDEILLVKRVTNDTTIELVYPAQSTVTSDFFVIPDDICSAVKYLAVKSVYDWYFTEQSYNQGAELFKQNFNTTGKLILDKIVNGKYYNSNLKPQVKEKTQARSTSVNQNGTETDILAAVDQYNSWWTSSGSFSGE